MDFTNEIGTKNTGLIRLQACVALLGRLGVSAQQLLSWSAFGTDATDEEPTAKDIQNTVKSKYDDTTWVTVGKPLNDTIREESKEALIAYILAHANAASMEIAGSGWRVDHHLRSTLRILSHRRGHGHLHADLAHRTGERRCPALRAALSYDLEKHVSPSAFDTAQWEWMKNFRVWQAAREVFLYPENWMVPQLRDDKTPFFEDLESALLQNPITAANVEQAYLDYLTALNEVSRLDIRGTYWQFDPNSTPAPDHTPDATNDVLHVFGRTMATPHKYYYRRLLNCSRFIGAAYGASWTPWEVVDLDIQSDHLVPVVWDGRLYLFWPTLTETAEASKQDPSRSPGHAAAQFFHQPTRHPLIRQTRQRRICRSRWLEASTNRVHGRPSLLGPNGICRLLW